MKKYLFPIAGLFVLYLIGTSPAEAGVYANNFGGFMVDFIAALGQFLSGLFTGVSE